MVKCEICGKEFKRLSWKHLYYKHSLSVDEYRALGYHTGVEKVCLVCSKMFIPDNREQETCGAKCGYALAGQRRSGENNYRWGKTFKHTEETKQKIRKNNCKYWQGKKRPTIGKKISAKLKGRTNVALKGRKFPGRKSEGQFLKGLEPWNKGKKMPPEYGRKVSEAMYATPGAIRYGPDNSSWKGGIKQPIDEERKTQTYREWRTSVFKRDNYTCQICNKHGGKLIAHHIKSHRDFPELRFVLSNGITLCRSHHSSLHNNPNFAARYPHLLIEKDTSDIQLMLPCYNGAL